MTLHQKVTGPRVPDRAARKRIIFVLNTGFPWQMLLQHMGCSPEVTYERRLRDWREAGVWDQVHREPSDRLGVTDCFDRSQSSLDPPTVPAKRASTHRL